MKKNTQPLQPDTYYHIYNRGINGTAIFNEPKNYYYFLKLYAKYIPLVADTYAYCLMGNHFHLLIRTKNIEEVLKQFNLQTDAKNKPNSFYYGNQFSKLFNSYVQAFNKMYNRTGALLENPFRRIEVLNDKYFTELIYYIHSNPSKHGIYDDFTQYPYSSYSAYISDKNTRLNKSEVIDWFGNKQEFIRFHCVNKYKSKLITEHLMLDF